jgi:hypothetical protein
MFFFCAVQGRGLFGDVAAQHFFSSVRSLDVTIILTLTSTNPNLMSNGTWFKTLDSEDAALNPKDPGDAVLSPRNSEDVTVNGERNAKIFTPT